MERLGIAEEMKSRIVLETRPGGSVTAVVEGKAELGFALLSEIVPVPEPATIALVSLLVLVIGWRERNRLSCLAQHLGATRTA